MYNLHHIYMYIYIYTLYHATDIAIAMTPQSLPRMKLDWPQRQPDMDQVGLKNLTLFIW